MRATHKSRRPAHIGSPGLFSSTPRLLARHWGLPERPPPRGRQAARVGAVHSAPNPTLVVLLGRATHKPRRPAHIGSPGLFSSTPRLLARHWDLPERPPPGGRQAERVGAVHSAPNFTLVVLLGRASRCSSMTPLPPPHVPAGIPTGVQGKACDPSGRYHPPLPPEEARGRSR